MLKSMTGFGRVERAVGDKTFLIDIKSLNGKQFELMLKMPAFLKPFEFEIRKIIFIRRAQALHGIASFFDHLPDQFDDAF